MDTIRASRGARHWLGWLVLLGPAWYVLAASYVVGRRFTFPFELEWMEGGSLIEVTRLLHGKPLYTAPSLAYIPYVYPPFYFYLSALTSRLTGIYWFLPLRVVSIAATLGTGLLIYFLVRTETGSHYWGLVAAGLFAAGFHASGFWFDIARTDMLCIFLFVAGTYALVRTGRRGALLAGLLFALAFYTKQTVVLPVLATVVYLLLLRNWRPALILGAMFAAASLLFVLVENSLSDGWYSFYVFYLPSLHRLIQPAWLSVFVVASRVCALLVVALLLGLLPLMVAPRRALQDSRGLLAVITLSALAVSILGNAQPGGYENANLPMLATVPILAGLGGAWLESRPELQNRPVILPIVYLLLLAQFGYLSYNPLDQIPSAAEADAGRQIVASIASTPGEVFVPYHSYLALLAGKNPSAHQVTLWELAGDFGIPDKAMWAGLEAEISSTLASQHYQRILLDHLDHLWQAVPLYYEDTGRRYSIPSAYNPREGQPAPRSLEFTPK